MDAAFNELKATGHNNFGGIIKWMKESKLIDGNPESIKSIKALFAGQNLKNIGPDEFKNAMSKFAASNGISFDQISQKLMSGAKIVANFYQGSQSEDYHDDDHEYDLEYDAQDDYDD
ncbi:uncharacterized protein LOC142984950 [Anticarsia gemmatalis]|uniref:uncharacterized protein LOC142984950 n=1 Tax=Anticarsia gemmatalis TaxID=129554 RepID=UPI003F76EE7E